LGKKGARKKLKKGIQDLFQVACDLTELYVLITLMRDSEKVRDEYYVQVKGRQNTRWLSEKQVEPNRELLFLF